MRVLKHYLGVYRKFISTSMQVDLSFRTSFTLLVIMDIFFFMSILTSINFIYDHVSTIGHWKKEQFLFFSAFILSIELLHNIIFSRNFWELSVLIKTGELDYIILKPISSLFSVFFRHLRVATCFSYPIIIFFLVKYGREAGLAPWDWIFLPVYLLLGLTLLALVECCLSVGMFWMVEGIGINFLRLELQNVSRWPGFIFPLLYRKFFTLFVPILLVGWAPVQFIFDKGRWMPMLQLIILIAIFYGLLLFLWRKGLEHYDSASS